MTKQILLTIALAIWIMPGIVMVSVINKGFQAFELGPFNGQLYSILTILLWMSPAIIFAYRRGQTETLAGKRD